MMRKQFLFLMVVCMVLLAVLVGCKSQKDEPSVVKPPAEPLILAENGSTTFVIVRGDSAGTAVVSAASNLWSVIREKTGTKIDLCDEFRYQEKGNSPAIVVGLTADETSRRIRNELHYDDYMIHVENGNLYLIGGSDEATVNAVNYFIEHYLAETVTTLQVEDNLDLRYVKDYPVKQLSIAGTGIDSYRIVYDSRLYYSRSCAINFRDLIRKTCGVVLAVVPDTEAATENEILVGETNREESKTAIAAFDRPNIYWSVKVSGKKIVLANQGARSGDAAVAGISAWLTKNETETCNLTASNFNLSGNIISGDKLMSRVVPREAETDVRTLQSNVLGFLSGDNDNGYTDQQRAELLMDTYLIYSPDIITLNEMNPGGSMTPILEGLLKPYYTIVDAEYLPLFAEPEKPSTLVSQRKCAMKVAYRKDAGLTLIDSGFSYFSEMAYFHGCSWAVFEMPNGNRFLAASCHLPENVDSAGNQTTEWAEETMQILDVARSRYGDLPMVLSGDWFFWSGKAPYTYMTENQHFLDVAQTAVAQYSSGVGTYHLIGNGSQSGAHEDITFVSDGWFTPLKHRIVVDIYTINASDHYPVLADLKFAKSPTQGDIPSYDPRTEHLEMKNELPGGSGAWQSGETYDGELPTVDPAETGALLLEITDLSGTQKNEKTGATYTQTIGVSSFYSNEGGTMKSLAVGGNAQTVVYGGKTNLVLDGKSKYTVSYYATLSSVVYGSGLRISYAGNNNSIGFYTASSGATACLAWGDKTSPGYSGYKSYTAEMKQGGSVYCYDGYAKFDLEIDGYVVSGYVNDVLLFREDLREPSNASAATDISKNWMSDTLCIVWHEYTKADQEAGTVSTQIKDLRVYSGLLHQKNYDLSLQGIQVGAVAEGNRSVRIVMGGMNDSFAKVGVEIYAKVGGEVRVFRYETDQVAKKLTAGETDSGIGEVAAANECFLFCYTISDLPGNESAEFVILPYAIGNETRINGAAQATGFNSDSGTPILVDFAEFGF